MRLLCVAGARPNFVKLASLVEAARHRSDVEVIIIHTGQHYDEKMSKEIFDDLGLPEPDENLDVRSASHGVQIARILERFEPLLARVKPDAVLVVGDVNSTAACSILASRARIPLVHVEAGLRSFDRSMPEEVNRLLTDSIADFLFVTEPSGMDNLKKEGVPEERCFLVGNTMVDTLLHHLDRARAIDMRKKLSLGKDEDYGVVTLHRPSTVDDGKVLCDVCEALSVIAKRIRLVFPVHPRTRDRLRHHSIDLSSLEGILLTEPLSYLEFLSLQAGSRILLTDSGGIQEEAVITQVPCVTLRENTERPVTITAGVNRLVGHDKQAIIEEALRILDNPPIRVDRPQGWDGKAGDRILATLVEKIPQLGLR